jgi:hypothetical protein
MRNRLLKEMPLPRDGRERGKATTRLPRSVTMNLAESPLGWLRARGLVTERQFEAGEQLRVDWERAQLAPLEARHRPAVDGELAGGERHKAVDGADQRGLAGP